MSLLLILVGSLAIFFAVSLISLWVPALMVFRPPDTLVSHPLPPDEYRGYVLYYSNGCNYCHTFYSRYWDNSGYPRAQAGDFNYQNPLILGSERTGPDLSYIGRKRSIAWIIEHEKYPRRFMPNSIMPNWDFLPDDDLQAIATFLFNVGDRVSGEQQMPPPAPYTNRPNPLPMPSVTPPPTSEPGGWPTWTAAGLQEGKELYLARCFTCHGCAGNGLGHYAGKLFIPPANLKAEPFRSMSDSEWFWRLSEGVPGTVMPIWKDSGLTEAQLWHIIRYAQEVFSRPVMRLAQEGMAVASNPAAGEYAGLTNPLPLTTAALEEGKSIYVRECMVCHGCDGRGTGPYREGLMPPPADLHLPSRYNSFTDADWFWRLREGMPWTAMPAWKMQYSADDLWAVVHYVRVFFAQTEPLPPTPSEQLYPSNYLQQELPAAGVSYLEGQRIYLNYCAQCHGAAGQGEGWGGQYLIPRPSAFANPIGLTNTQGMLFAKTSLGIAGSAMPPWNEFLFEGQRWAVVKYIIEAFQVGRPVNRSVMQDDAVAAGVATLSLPKWEATGHTISLVQGQQLYGTYCAGCHNDLGQGNGPATRNTPSGGPAPFPADMSLTYAYWRTAFGVTEPESTMPAFRDLRVLTEDDLWNMAAYVATLTGTNVIGGGS